MTSFTTLTRWKRLWSKKQKTSFTRPGGPQERREQGTRGGGLQNAACRTKPAQTERVPYLLLQYIKSTDTQEQGQEPESECTVRIVAATYSEDESEGAMCVLNLLTRIRVALLKDGVVGGRSS